MVGNPQDLHLFWQLPTMPQKNFELEDKVHELVLPDEEFADLGSGIHSTSKENTESASSFNIIEYLINQAGKRSAKYFTAVCCPSGIVTISASLLRPLKLYVQNEPREDRQQLKQSIHLVPFEFAGS